MPWLAEGFGALAVLLNFFGYRQTNVNRYLIVSALALFSVSLHFYLIDAMAASVACALAGLRNVVVVKIRGQAILYMFVSLNVSFLCYEWFVLQHDWIIFVAYTSALIFTIGSIVLKDTNNIRRWFILAEGLGLTYSILVGSVFGTIFNSVNLLSILIKIYQDRGRQKA